MIAYKKDLVWNECITESTALIIIKNFDKLVSILIRHASLIFCPHKSRLEYLHK